MNRILLFVIATVMALATVYGRDVNGKVLGEGNAPLDFVNVVLYCDSTYIAGGITDAEGCFSIIADTDCALTLRASCFGYEDGFVNVPATGNVGVITLVAGSLQLGEVEVRATRPSTVMKGNALVTNVDGSPLALAGTANDVLVRVPMVVDNGGTLEVFGKGIPAIYINGRRVNDLQELSQLNSQDIRSVEVITNPGAAYAADVKSVIRIRTKPPKSDGWSGTLCTDNGFQHYFRTGNSIDLKYRTRGLEIFANYGWWRGDNRFDRLNDMTTTTANATYNQTVRTIGRELYNDMTGKLGLSWMIDDRHSLGAYYQNSWNRHATTGSIPSEVWQNGSMIGSYTSAVHNESTALPRHYVNLYYNGSVGTLGIDFNADWLWYKSRETTFNAETATQGADRDVNTSTTNRNRMFAEKLVLSYPLWNGGIEVGEEYTCSHNYNLFTTNLAEIGDADNRVDESNIAAFVEFGQQIGRFNIEVGIRYEHVKFEYYEMAQQRDNQSKTYNNLFPSLNIATQVGPVRMGLNYTGKTLRPGYGQLDGTVSYINRLTYETGNPYLRPTKMQTVEYMAQWRRFFAQLSYTYFKDGVYHVTEPYATDGEATLIKTSNLPHRHYFQAFVGGNFQLGVWQQKVNVGMMKQWLTLPVSGEPTKMDTPIFMFQWQNAVHLPFDIWLNVDAQLMTRGWDTNTRLANTPWYVNAKLYKGLFNNTFGITLEAKDLFDSAKKDFNLYSDAVQIMQKNYSPGRSVMLTLQYRFNSTRDRYRGTGAGNAEKSRF